MINVWCDVAVSTLGESVHEKRGLHTKIKIRLTSFRSIVMFSSENLPKHLRQLESISSTSAFDGG